MSNSVVAVSGSRSLLVYAAAVTGRGGGRRGRDARVGERAVGRGHAGRGRAGRVVEVVPQVLAGVADHPEPIGGRVEVDAEVLAVQRDGQLGDPGGAAEW